MPPIELMSPDLVRFAFVFGMVLSVILYEKSHLTTGSIVVPGFLGIHVFEPLYVFASILNAWICYSLVHQLVSRYCMLKPKFKFHAVILTSIGIQVLWELVSTTQTPLALAGNSLAGFGYVIPGLIAHDMSRNGALKTGANAILASGIVALTVFVLLTLMPNASLNRFSTELTHPNLDLVTVLTLGAIGAVALKSQTPIQSGGYVSAGFLVFTQASPTTILLVASVACPTYLTCCGLLIPRMIIFGRRKFATMLIVGSVSMWSTLHLANSMGLEISYSQHPAYAGIMILIPGLIANDVQRTSFFNVALGLCLLSSWILVMTGLWAEFNFRTRPSHILGYFAALSGVFLTFLLIKLPKLSVDSSQNEQPNTSSQLSPQSP